MNATMAYCQKLTINEYESALNLFRLQELFPKSEPECLILIRTWEMGNEKGHR